MQKEALQRDVKAPSMNSPRVDNEDACEDTGNTFSIRIMFSIIFLISDLY